MKISLALAGAVLLGSTLTACGGSSDGGGGGGEGGDYCKDVKKAAKTFGGVSGGDVEQLDKAFASFHTLADEAPSDIKDDWTKLDGAITDVEKALKDAGLKFSDLAELQQGKAPDGVDMSKLSGLASEMSKLNGPEFTKASKAIDTHARKVCKVDLNAS
jgi:hypothetical protein